MIHINCWIYEVNGSRKRKNILNGQYKCCKIINVKKKVSSLYNQLSNLHYIVKLGSTCCVDFSYL